MLSTRPALTSWHDGVDKEVLITALIGIHKKVHFRCRACHSKDPHAEYVLRANDLAIEGALHNPIVIE